MQLEQILNIAEWVAQELKLIHLQFGGLMDISRRVARELNQHQQSKHRIGTASIEEKKKRSFFPEAKGEKTKKQQPPKRSKELSPCGA